MSRRESFVTEKPPARTKAECRESALNMAVTQVQPHRYADGAATIAARDVVRMAKTYYDWLWSGRVPGLKESRR